MNSNTVRLGKNELDKAFSLYKSSLHEFVDAAFGWDEQYQQNRFASSYPIDTLYWILIDDIPKGIWCVNENDTELHLHLVLLKKEFRGQGVGKHLFAALHEQAKAASKNVSLSCFKANTKALRFYRKLGYQIVGDDEHFYDLLFLV